MSEPKPKRPLVRGTLRPPKVNPSNPSNPSYTQPPTSRDDLSIGAQGKNVKVVEFNSSATPQAFLDPSIFQKTAQREKEWKLAQEKNARSSGGQAENSSAGDERN